jgi:hypothetical protein
MGYGQKALAEKLWENFNVGIVILRNLFEIAA